MVRPQVFVRENILSSLSLVRNNRFCAIITPATWGPIDESKMIENYSQYVNVFGSGHDYNKAIQLFFNNGGLAKVVRIEDTTASESSVTLENSEVGAISLEGKYKGSYGNNISVIVEENDSNRNLIISDGAITEVYSDLSSNTDIVEKINSDSSLVTATKLTDDLIDTITETFLTGGTDGDDSLTSSIYLTALNEVLVFEDFNILWTPGQTDNSFHTSMIGGINNRISTEGKYSRYISGVDLNESISTSIARSLLGERATILAGGVKIEGSDYDSSYLAGAYCGALVNKEIGISMTNKPLVIDGVVQKFTRVQQDVLVDNNLTVVALDEGNYKVINAITRVTDSTSVYRQEVVVDEVDEARKRYVTRLQQEIGNPNTSSNRINVSNSLDNISETLVSEGVIEEYDDAVVKIPEDESGNTIDNAIEAEIGIKPVFATEYIYLTLNIRG